MSLEKSFVGPLLIKKKKNLTLVINDVPQDKRGSQPLSTPLDTDANKAVSFPTGVRVSHGHCQDAPLKQSKSFTPFQII